MTSTSATSPTIVIPGQPLFTLTPGVSKTNYQAGNGTYSRRGNIYASLMGQVVREGGVISVIGKDDSQSIPEPNSTVIGTVTRITRLSATLSLLTVNGKPCRSDFIGIIRSQDVRQTAKDSVKISLGDSRSYFLSTASNSLGVLFAINSETGNTLKAISWDEMQDPITGVKEGRKVAGPE